METEMVDLENGSRGPVYPDPSNNCEESSPLSTENALNTIESSSSPSSVSDNQRRYPWAALIGRGLYVIAFLVLLVLFRVFLSQSIPTILVWICIIALLASFIRLCAFWKQQQQENHPPHGLLRHSSHSNMDSPRVLLVATQGHGERAFFPLYNPLGFRMPALERDFDVHDYTSLFHLENQKSGRGASTEQIDLLPTSVMTRETLSKEPMKSCPICLDDINEGDVLRIMPCMHKFHSKCLSKWLKIRAICPICKFELLSNNDVH